MTRQVRVLSNRNTQKTRVVSKRTRINQLQRPEMIFFGCSIDFLELSANWEEGGQEE